MQAELCSRTPSHAPGEHALPRLVNHVQPREQVAALLQCEQARCRMSQGQHWLRRGCFGRQIGGHAGAGFVLRKQHACPASCRPLPSLQQCPASSLGSVRCQRLPLQQSHHELCQHHGLVVMQCHTHLHGRRPRESRGYCQTGTERLCVCVCVGVELPWCVVMQSVNASPVFPRAAGLSVPGAARAACQGQGAGILGPASPGAPRCGAAASAASAPRAGRQRWHRPAAPPSPPPATRHKAGPVGGVGKRECVK